MWRRDRERGARHRPLSFLKPPPLSFRSLFPSRTFLKCIHLICSIRLSRRLGGFETRRTVRTRAFVLGSEIRCVLTEESPEHYDCN